MKVVIDIPNAHIEVLQKNMQLKGLKMPEHLFLDEWIPKVLDVWSKENSKSSSFGEFAGKQLCDPELAGRLTCKRLTEKL